MKASVAQFSRLLKAHSVMMKREKVYKWTVVLSVLILLLTFLLPIWKIIPSASLKPFLPLHYNVIFGIDRFGPWYHIFWIPAFGLLTILLNLTIGTFIYNREKLMTTILILGSLCAQLVLICSMTLIVLVNL